MKLKFKIGQRVWAFEANRRIYGKPAKGRIWTSGPIYAEHFVARIIVGVEGRSYLVGHPDNPATYTEKIGITKAEKILRTDAEKAEAIWIEANRYKIKQAVEDYIWRRASYSDLKHFADLVGYVEKKEP